MLHDAMAEMVAEQASDPTQDREKILLGMRLMAGLLGMPEGHSHYEWEVCAEAGDRRARRLSVLRALRRR
jgi:hypothetical protein